MTYSFWGFKIKFLFLRGHHQNTLFLNQHPLVRQTTDATLQYFLKCKKKKIISGTKIVRIKAIGVEDLHYSIVPAPGEDEDSDDDLDETEFFSVDNDGQIFLSQPLDREKTDTHMITIMASTDGSPAVMASTEVIIQVLDVNEHPPEFESNPYRIVIAENAPKGTSVIRGTTFTFYTNMLEYADCLKFPNSCGL